MGDIPKDSKTLDSSELYDGKEIYLQIINRKNYYEQCPLFKGGKQTDVLSVLFRRWDSVNQTLGPVIEVIIDKGCYLNKLAIFLSEKVYSDVASERIQAVKLTTLGGFKREELHKKRWNVIKTQATKVAQSALKITKDSEVVIIKDSKQGASKNHV